MPSPNRGNFPNNNAYKKALENYARKGKGQIPNIKNILRQTNMLHQMNIPNLEALMKVSHEMRNLVGPILRNKIRTAKTLIKKGTAESIARRAPLVAHLRTREGYGGQKLSENNKKFLLSHNIATWRRQGYTRGLQPTEFMLAPAPSTMISRHPFSGYTNNMRYTSPHGNNTWMYTYQGPQATNRYKETGRLTAGAKRFHRSNTERAFESQLAARRVAALWLKKFRARKAQKKNT